MHNYLLSVLVSIVPANWQSPEEEAAAAGAAASLAQQALAAGKIAAAAVLEALGGDDDDDDDVTRLMARAGVGLSAMAAVATLVGVAWAGTAIARRSKSELYCHRTGKIGHSLAMLHV